MECEKMREKFSSLLEGDLDPSEEKTVREHLASCSRCQGGFETFKRTMKWIHSVEEVQAPEGFLAEIYRKMGDRNRVGYTQEWVHRLMRLRLPAQAVAMVAIVFSVLYITKMLPMERYREKNVDVSRTARSEGKTDTHSPEKEAKAENQGIALLSKAPRTKEMEQEKIPLREGKEIEKAAIPALAAKPSHEIILRVQDQAKAVSQLQDLVKEFGGETARQEGYIVLASLPAASYPQFEKKLGGMASPQKAEPPAPRQVASRALRMSPSSKEEEPVGKGEEEEIGRPMADQSGCITVRILLVKE
jgi:hypothetical protein